MEAVAETQHDLVDLINVALEELVRARFELPGFSTLERMARDIRAANNEKLYQSVSDALVGAEQMQLSELFYCPAGEVTTPWNEVKQEPGSPKLGELQRLVERLHWLQPLQVAGSALAAMPEVKRLNFAAQAQSLEANQMKELPDAKRHTLAVALLQWRYAQTLDDIAEVFVKRMRRMHYRAKEALENYRAESQQRTDELVSKLRQMVIAHSTDGEMVDRFTACKPRLPTFAIITIKWAMPKRLPRIYRIGSGVTESGCKMVVKSRLCGAGMKWKEAGAAVVLSLRSLSYTQGRWAQFWAKINQYGFSLAF